MPGRPKNRDTKKAVGKPARDTPADFSPVTREDWDFDSVPDAEIIACCFWEYARESKTIQMRAGLHWCQVRHIIFREEYERNPALTSQHDEVAERIKAQAKHQGFDDDGFADKFWNTDFPLIGIYGSVTELVRDGASPWRRLPADLRAYLTKQVSESIVLHPLVMAWVGQLEELWKANSAALLEIRAQVRDEMDDSEDAAKWTETVAVEPFADDEDAKHEYVTAALTIDFSRFTDEEITEAFRKWLKQRRPKEWKHPRRVFPGARQRGRKLVEYRVALERLALMRLLHWFSPAELQAESPDAWRKIRGKEQSFRREIREAAKFFRKLFPFLPADERPHHEPRHGTWLPPMLKIADEVWREM